MVSPGMLRRVAVVRIDVSEEPSASFIRVTRIGELGTTQAPTSIPEDTILHSHRRENLKSFYNRVTNVEGVLNFISVSGRKSK
jgi:hypothetical protein